MKKLFHVFFFAFFFIIFCYGQKNIKQNDSTSISRVLLIYNSSYKAYLMPLTHIKEYLDHFGVAYDEKDLKDSIDAQYVSYNLILIAHDSIISNLSIDNITKLKVDFEQALIDSVGILSFSNNIFEDAFYKTCDSMKTVSFSKTNHFIIQNHDANELITFNKPIAGCIHNLLNSRVLIESNGIPLLSCLNYRNGNIAYWSTYLWMRDVYLGPMRGLDDCFLRSIIWAAKKPFFVRGFPPIVTLRIDDAYGTGETWNKSPFYWVKMASDNKFKPWLGLFIDNMDSISINELKNYSYKGICTSMAHSFEQTNYLYFNHPSSRPFPDSTSIKNMKLVDNWYNRTKLPKSTYLLPHYYEIGTTCLEYAINNWGIKYLGLIVGSNKSYWVDKALKIKLYEYDRTDVTGGSINSFANADYYIHGNSKVFNGLTEIRDWGYDWAPSNDVPLSILRGSNIISRSLQSMNFAELFTHEATYLVKVKPDNWELILKGINNSIAKYNPYYLTVDSAMKVLESTHNSKIKKVNYESGSYKVEFTGNTIAPTSLYVYTSVSDSIYQTLFEIPNFNDQYEYIFNPDCIIPRLSFITDSVNYSSQINISKNPVKNNFSISLPEVGGLYDVKFFNVFGNIIYSTSCKKTTDFNSSIFPSIGIYFVRISNKFSNKVIKILYE